MLRDRNSENNRYSLKHLNVNKGVKTCSRTYVRMSLRLYWQFFRQKNKFRLICILYYQTLNLLRVVLFYFMLHTVWYYVLNFFQCHFISIVMQHNCLVKPIFHSASNLWRTYETETSVNNSDISVRL